MYLLHLQKAAKIQPKTGYILLIFLARPSARRTAKGSSREFSSASLPRPASQEGDGEVKAGPSDAGSLPRELKESIARLGKQDEVAGDPLLRAQARASGAGEARESRKDKN